MKLYEVPHGCLIHVERSVGKQMRQSMFKTKRDIIGMYVNIRIAFTSHI